MADLKEKVAEIEALAKEDEQFRNDYIDAVKAQDIEGIAALLTSKGFEITAEELQAQIDGAREMDEAELQAVAGGANRFEKINEYCGDTGEFLCGFGLGVALYSPKFNDD